MVTSAPMPTAIFAALRADDAAAEDDDPPAPHAGHAAEEDALAAVLLLQAHRRRPGSAMRPATSLIGRSSGSEPSSSWIVS